MKVQTRTKCDVLLYANLDDFPILVTSFTITRTSYIVDNNLKQLFPSFIFLFLDNS